MYLLKATIENFLILKEAEVPLDAKSLVLVLGYSNDGGKADSNGVGKSSLFEAVCWCLYGKTYKGLSHDDVVSTRSKGGTKVQVDLLLGNQEINVIRHRQHKTGKNKLLVIIDGVNKTPFKQADAAILLNSLLPLSYTAFQHVCYFGQGMKSKFLSLNDTGRKKLLEELLGLQVFSDAEKIVKQKLRVVKDKQLKLYGNKEVLEDHVADLSDKIKSLAEAKTADLAVIETECDRINGEQLRYAREKGKFQEAVKDCSYARERVRQQLADAKSVYSGLRDSRDGLIKSMTRLSGQLDALEEREQKLSGLGVCDQCEQEVPEKHVVLRLAEIDEEKDTIQGGITQVETLMDDIDLSEQNELVEALVEKMQRVRDKETTNTLEINRISGLIQKNRGILRVLEGQKKAAVRPCDKLTESLRETEEELAEVVVKLEQAEREQPYLDYWEKGFSTTGIRSLLLDDVITYLNSRMAHHSRVISDGEIAIQLSPQTRLKSGEIREKMSVEASTGGAGYQAASGGQQRRMDLAVHFALSDLTSMVTGHRINLLICDEVLDCIDETGTDAILMMLEDKTRDGMTVFLIDHTDAVKDNVEKILVVTQDSGSSTTELT
jgi:DNA repair exonuclease SbcCD ATPase subunit